MSGTRYRQTHTNSVASSQRTVRNEERTIGSWSPCNVNAAGGSVVGTVASAAKRPKKSAKLKKVAGSTLRFAVFFRAGKGKFWAQLFTLTN
jgi:hypothetical protein